MRSWLRVQYRPAYLWDKGKQIKLDKNGLRIPALFKKEVLPVVFPKPVYGFVRSIEFFKRKGVWLASICYNTPFTS